MVIDIRPSGDGSQIPHIPPNEKKASRADKGAQFLDAEIARTKAEGPRFPRVWIDDATVDIETAYLVKSVIERGKLIVIYGPAGDGKTFFTADLAGHIAAGIPWRGRRTRAGLVVYVAAEAGASILRRFFAWREHRMGEAREGRTPMAIITRGCNLLNAVEVEALLLELRAIATEVGMPVALVIFDTLSRSIPGGDENRSEDMTRVIAAADAIRDELAATCLIVHHSGKDGSRGARGHSSLFGASDTVISVIERVATVEKSRDGTQGDQFPFALDVVDLGTDSDGDAVTTCIVRHLDDAPAPRRRPSQTLSGVARVALHALTEAITEHGKTMPGTSTIPAGVRAVTLDRWRAQFKLRYGTDPAGDERDQGAVKMAFRRAREQLAKSVGVSDPYVWLTR